MNLKTRAMRSGVWFKTLQRIDRVLFDLTIRVVDTIRSARLTRSIAVIARKLKVAVESGFSGRLRVIGLLWLKKSVLRLRSWEIFLLVVGRLILRLQSFWL